LPQAYWGAFFCTLFGFSYESLRISTFVLGEVGLLASYLLLRELGAKEVVAALGALTMGCSPLYLNLSVTFMTDVPFTALVLVSLSLYVRGANRGALGPIVAAYVVALLALLIRQFALVLPIAFATAQLMQHRWTLRRSLLVGTPILLFAAVHLGFQRWMVATGRTTGFMVPVEGLLHLDLRAALFNAGRFLPVIPSLGLLVLPFVALLPPWVARRQGTKPRNLYPLAATIVLGLALCALWWLKGPKGPPLVGNVLAEFGVGPLTLPDTYLLRRNFPYVPGAEVFWPLMAALGCFAAAVLTVATGRVAGSVVAGVRKWEDRRTLWPHALLLTFLTAYFGSLVLVGLMAPMFDRYFLLLVPPLCGILVLGAGRSVSEGRSRYVVAGALLAGMAALAVASTHDWLAWHRARWEAIAFLTGQGVTPSQMDGGYEFHGVTTYHPSMTPRKGLSWWWVHDDAYVIASGPLPGFEEVAGFGFSPWLWHGVDRVLVLRRLDDAR
jgi:hypothetical protein